MNMNDNRRKAHDELDHVFKDLFPARDMAERPAQSALSHRMLDAMLDGGIALCDAGTGIGKTYAYLAAGTMYSRFRADCGLETRPILISTSSIALQNAVRDEYLPFLSSALLADEMVTKPIQAVIRKGKAHYVCDERLEHRLQDVASKKKNKRAKEALLSLREHLDSDEAPYLSGYDKERISVPKVCDCSRENCRYLLFLDDCDKGAFLFHICNHNLLLADAIHRGSGCTPILPDICALVVDEAHKLPETARQMFGTTLEARDIQALIRSLRREDFLLAAETLAELSAPLLRMMARPFEDDKPFEDFASLLTAPARNLHIINKQLDKLLTVSTHRQLQKLTSTSELFTEENPDMVFYTREDKRGGTMLCATISDTASQLRHTLWRLLRPMVLTSGTLSVGKDFRRFKEETGLLTDSRVTETVSLSPFDYQRNCLLYLPQNPPDQRKGGYYSDLTAEITKLLKATHGHALILFTSYVAMAAVGERLSKGTLYPLFMMGRSTAVHTLEQFKSTPGSVLLATGAAWEGFDFPGDDVSLLVIPRLPFATPDALKEREKEKYPDLKSFIRAVAVPDMQIKLKQGFGRAIRTEKDTCVVAVLDGRAAIGGRYFKDVLAALPEMPVTSSLKTIRKFIRAAKPESYFREGSPR